VGIVVRVTPDTVERKPNAGSEANTAFTSPAFHTWKRPGTPASSAAVHANAARRCSAHSALLIGYVVPSGGLTSR
jgi:hypothetical protein